MTPLHTRARRVAVAAVALILAVPLFHGQISSALVVRGDELLVRKGPFDADNRYRRALFFDRNNGTAVDRILFAAMEEHEPASLRAAVGLADGYLTRNAQDTAVRADRALCLLVERRYAAAATDFEAAANASADPQGLVFAGWARRRIGDRRDARRLWLRALRLRPGYRPAAVALAENAK